MFHNMLDGVSWATAYRGEINISASLQFKGLRRTKENGGTAPKVKKQVRYHAIRLDINSKERRKDDAESVFFR